jgi:phytoene dehydrogenase-like protein
MIPTSENASPRTDLLIVGGGLAGLTAAAQVAREGRSVLVVEQADTLGGRAASHIRQGIHFNLGPHALYCRGHAFRVFKELGVGFTGRVPNPGRGLLFTKDSFQSAPLGLGTLLVSRLLTLREKWRFIRLLTTLPRLDTRRFDRVPLRAWVEGAAGRGNLATLLLALFRLSTYVDDPERFSAGAALDQLRLGLAGNVWYLDGGWQTLVEGLRDRAVAHGAEIRTRARVRSVQSHNEGVSVQLADGAVLQSRTVILALGPKAACELLDLPADALLARWVAQSLPIRAASLDVALARLPRPDHRFALGLDRPLYYSVHSAAAKLAPNDIAVLHVMKYLGKDTATPAEAVQAELEAFLDRLQPGWKAHTVAQRFLPGMTVAHGLPCAEDGGLSGRPGVTVPEQPNVFLAGDWVGAEGLLADAAVASATEAARHVLDRVRAPCRPQRSPSHARS